MANIINIGNTRTPFTYVDSYLPRQQKDDADKAFKAVFSTKKQNTATVLEFTSKLSKLLKETKPGEMEMLWSAFEKTFNHKQPITIKSSTPSKQLQTTFILLYNSLNVIDQEAVSTSELRAFQMVYLNTKNHVQNRFLTRETGREKQVLTKMIDTMDKRLNRVITNFNTRVDKGEIQGPQLK